MTDCKHLSVYWKLAPCNEDGWECLDCGAHLGFRPDLDDDALAVKVDSVLQALHDQEFVYVSNGTMGEYIVRGVVKEVRALEHLDQQSIIVSILRDPNMAGDRADFWRRRRAEAMA